MENILLLGAGKIGAAIAELLGATGDYDLVVADRDPTLLKAIHRHDVRTMVVDVEDAAALRAAAAGREAVISALPFHLNVRVAEAARDAGLHYFDLTEDVATAHRIRVVADGGATAFMPQCGLAPGFIAIAGADLARRFDALEALHMRVGALPIFPTNALLYNLTWSTDGLINEYCNLCEVIHDGRRMEVLPLQGIEQFLLDGVTYEAFNTSGGLGTLCETFDGKVRELDYKTVRYPGHCERMRLLIDDLKLGARRELLKDVLEHAIPVTLQDVVLAFATATGQRDGRLTQESSLNKVYAREINGRTWSAIQVTTAAGVCAMVDLMREGTLPDEGFVRQEEVPLDAFLANRFGRYYAAD
jgi:saccharopine dehydrogenase-like NADP-dependent oxidoreductase